MERGTETREQVIRRATTLNLQCHFTEDEKKALSGDLVKAIGDLEDTESKKERVDADLKGQIKLHEGDVRVLSGKLRAGYEYRAVPCEEQSDFRVGKVRVLRLDTGEHVTERAMTSEERQIGFAFKEVPG